MTPRRTFLKSIAATLALPSLPSLRAATAATAAAPDPDGLRLHPERREPRPLATAAGSGKDYTMSKTLEPLAGLRDHFSVLRGLDHDKAEANGDGGRRPRPRQRHLPHRLPGPQDRRRRHRASANPSTRSPPARSATRPACLRSNSPPIPPAAPATATPATPAPTSSTSPGATRPPPPPPSATRGWSSRSSSAPATSKEDSRRRAYRKSILDFVDGRRQAPPVPPRLDRPRQDGRIPHRRPRHRTADRKGREIPRRDPRGPAPRRHARKATANTSA